MLSLVVPTLNECGNIAPLAARVAAALGDEPFEVIIVDDSSTDGTPAEVRRVQKSLPWLRLLAREGERDLSRAVVAGWGAARGEVLGCMDADLQHPPELLPRMLAALRERNADVVIASRYAAGGGVGAWHPGRHLGSRAVTALTERLLPSALRGVSDPMSGYFLLRREAVALDRLRPSGYKILLEVLARCRPRAVTEVPFTFGRRGSGASKAGLRVSWLFLRQLFALASGSHR